MRPSNEFTSSDQRFFFPEGHEIEYHESIDVERLPGLITIGGQDHYAQMEGPNGTDEIACYLQPENYNLTPGQKLVQIASLKDGHGNRLHGASFIEKQDYPQFDTQTGSYRPQPGDTIMYQAQYYNARLEKQAGVPLTYGVVMVPFDGVVPDLPPSDIYHYPGHRLLGIINSDEKLVTWKDTKYWENKVLETCVALGIVQNAVELALIDDYLGNSVYLQGYVRSHPVIGAYLGYFDTKYGTHYLPTKEIHIQSRDFPSLTPDEIAKVERLGALARSFRTRD